MQSKSEKQNLEDTKALIRSAVSCIAYIREFFADDVFKSSRYQEMSLKVIEKGVTEQSDRLMRWIEEGCFEALEKKYLETMTLEIYEHPDSPTKPLETYTFSIEYPNSEQHQKILNNRNGHAKVTLKAGNKTMEVVSSQGDSFQHQIVKMLRTLCIIMQTLGPLPVKKFVALQLTYYDEITPPNYEPPGFCPGVFDSKFLFEKAVFKHDFGRVSSASHRVQLLMETIANKEDESKTAAVPHNEAIKEQAIDKPALEPLDSISEVPETRDVPVAHALLQETQETISGENPINDEAIPIDSDKIKCLCGDNQTDLDMIQCDRCEFWLHTPCAGFCTNRDKRIPEKYVCYNCEYSANKKLLKALQDLASFRRSISVVYAEGLQSIAWLSKRLGSSITTIHTDIVDCGVAKASKLIRRLESEGLIIKPNSQNRATTYTVIKSPEAKEKIRYYFSLELSAFAELAPYLKGRIKVTPAPASPTKALTPKKRPEKSPVKLSVLSKRRKSVTSLAVSCA